MLKLPAGPHATAGVRIMHYGPVTKNVWKWLYSRTLDAYGGSDETDGAARIPEVFDGSFVPAPLDGVASVAVDGEAVLLHVGSGALRHLDAVGAIVWACLDGASTVEEIVVDLAAEFGADRDTVRHDVNALVEVLWRDGLLRPRVRGRG